MSTISYVDSRRRWHGIVWDWKARFAFGKASPIPREVQLTVWASSLEEATTLLNIVAESQGYALGGVQNIVEGREAAELKPLPKKVERKKGEITKTLTYEEKLAMIARLEGEVSALETSIEESF